MIPSLQYAKIREINPFVPQRTLLCLLPSPSSPVPNEALSAALLDDKPNIRARLIIPNTVD
jgi:hypothetical protein